MYANEPIDRLTLEMYKDILHCYKRDDLAGALVYQRLGGKLSKQEQFYFEEYVRLWGACDELNSILNGH